MYDRPVVVIGGNVGALSAVRSLGRRGVPVIALSYDDRDLTPSSRHTSEVVAVPHPAEAEDDFIAGLLDRAPQWEGALLLETGDYPLAALARHKHLLSKHYAMVTPDREILEHFLRKDRTAVLAQRCGVATPHTRLVTDHESIDAIVADAVFPCVVKPVLGHEFLRRFGTKMLPVDDEVALRSALMRCREAEQAVVLQEIVAGDDGDVHQLHIYVDSGGITRARFFHRKIRQNPPQFGVMCAGVSTEPDPEVDRLAQRLLGAVGFRGVADIEFRRDRCDGVLKLIEVNARLPRTTWFSSGCGVDLPWLIYQDLVVGAPVTIDSHPAGVHGIELAGEFRRFLRRRVRPRELLAPYRSSSKVFAVADRADLRPVVRQFCGPLWPRRA